MKLHILPAGVGSVPLVLDATQLIVFNDHGQPVSLSYDVPQEQAVISAHALDDEFPRLLQRLGHVAPVRCDRLILPAPPPGARLVAGPGS